MKEGLEKYLKSPAELVSAQNNGTDIRLEISKAIVVHHAPTAIANADTLADYAVEMADALIARLEKPY